MLTMYCKLIASEIDTMSYQTYVFQCLEPNPSFGHKYIMITRVPNWQHRNLDIGECGFLTYQEVVAGRDAWYTQEGERVPYNYSNIYFIKFVKEKSDTSKTDIIL